MPPNRISVADPRADELVQRQVRLLGRVVDTSLAETSRLRFDPESLPQMVAIALHGTILELAHACGALVQSTDFVGIPILMRPMQEASVDLDNLLSDPGYVKNMEAADHERFTGLLRQSVPGTNPFLAGVADQRDVAAELIERERRLGELEAEGRGSLKIFKRFERAKREDEYRSAYLLLSLDAHNNFSAISERHFGERPDGQPTLSFFMPSDVAPLRSRLEAITGMALGSALKIHSAFGTLSGAFAPLAAERKALQTLIVDANSKARRSPVDR